MNVMIINGGSIFYTTVSILTECSNFMKNKG